MPFVEFDNGLNSPSLYREEWLAFRKLCVKLLIRMVGVQCEFQLIPQLARGAILEFSGIF